MSEIINYKSQSHVTEKRARKYIWARDTEHGNLKKYVRRQTHTHIQLYGMGVLRPLEVGKEVAYIVLYVNNVLQTFA